MSCNRVLCKTGRGTEEFHNILGRVDIINSTLGKALGGASGGYTTGPKELIDLLRQKSRPYLFSNSLPPPVVATGIKVMDMLMNSEELSQKVSSNTKRFREAMTKAGFTISGQDHPICPVMLGDARLASVFADKMLSRGIYVIGFSFPVVPHGKARIRVQISAAHTTEQIDRCIAAFIEVGKELKILSRKMEGREHAYRGETILILNRLGPQQELEAVPHGVQQRNHMSTGDDVIHTGKRGKKLPLRYLVCNHRQDNVDEEYKRAVVEKKKSYQKDIQQKARTFKETLRKKGWEHKEDVTPPTASE
uniref:Aminotransferase class I/classII large domain-containing protein n=1 Tax=Megaselia scalaris TaxID=36166 RepID=T1GRD8_MEGSC